MKTALLDGEMVVQVEHTLTDFNALRSAIYTASHRLVLVAFAAPAGFKPATIGDLVRNGNLLDGGGCVVAVLSPSHRSAPRRSCLQPPPRRAASMASARPDRNREFLGLDYPSPQLLETGQRTRLVGRHELRVAIPECVSSIAGCSISSS